MKKERRSIKERVANAIDMPKELTLDVSKLTVLGEKEVTIENYKGILEYTDCVIRIKTVGRAIKVTGDNLEIKVITDEEIQINGRIRCVEYIA